MREKRIEDHLKEGVEALGGLCEKFASPGQRGVPDRLVTLPKPVGMQLVECKRPEGSVAPWQARDHARRAKLGVRVAVAYTLEEVDTLVHHWKLQLLGIRP
ncbi:MAG: VRR-NUC domain-containing protein [Patescibacteria group bacterium]|nr:VRR-NUC domain-containing protein [Patescibacteria group bacterium]